VGATRADLPMPLIGAPPPALEQDIGVPQAPAPIRREAAETAPDDRARTSKRWAWTSRTS
jgi:hypothetical protein